MGTGRLGQGWHSCPGTDALGQPLALLWVHCDLGAALQPPAAQHCLTLHLTQSPGDIPRHCPATAPVANPSPTHGPARSEQRDHNPSRATPATAFHGSDGTPQIHNDRRGLCRWGLKGWGSLDPIPPASNPYCIPAPHSHCISEPHPYCISVSHSH